MIPVKGRPFVMVGALTGTTLALVLSIEQSTMRSALIACWLANCLTLTVLISYIRDANRRLRKPGMEWNVTVFGGDTKEFSANLAKEFNRERGYDRPREARSAEAHEMAKDAPMVTRPDPRRSR